MRVATVAALSAAFALSACSKESTPAKPQPPVAPAAAASAAPAVKDAPKVRLECQRLFSSELLTRNGLGGATGKTDATGTVLECDLTGKGRMKVGVNCPTWGSDAKVMGESMANGRNAFKGAKDIPGLGRSAYLGSMAGIAMIQFWDDDAPCFVSMTAMDEKVAIGVSRDLAASLTPASIAP